MHYRRSFVVAMLMITVVPLLIGCASRVVNTYRGVVYVADGSGDDRHVLLVAQRNLDLWPVFNGNPLDGRSYVLPLSSMSDELQELALADGLTPSAMPSGAALRNLLRSGHASLIKGESDEQYRTPIGRAIRKIPSEFEDATAWIVSVEPPTIALGGDFIEGRSRLDYGDASNSLSSTYESSSLYTWAEVRVVHEDDFIVKVNNLIVFNSSGRRHISTEHFDEPRTLGSFFDVGGEREQVEN